MRIIHEAKDEKRDEGMQIVVHNNGTVSVRAFDEQTWKMEYDFTDAEEAVVFGTHLIAATKLDEPISEAALDAAMATQYPDGNRISRDSMQRAVQAALAEIRCEEQEAERE